MAVEVPEPLQWVLMLLSGTRWPEGDEDQLRDMAARWRQAGEQLEEAGRAADSTVQRALDGQQGAAADALATYWSAYTSGADGAPGYFPGTAQACAGLGDMLEQMANSIETAKIQIIAQIVILAFEIATAEAEAPFTFGASLAEIPIAVGISRTVVQQILKTLLKEALQHAAKQAAIMGGVNLMAQTIEVAEGHRKSIDLKELGQNIEGGAVAGALGHGLGKGVGAAGSKVGLGNAMGSLPGRAATGAAVGVGTDVGTQLITTGEVDSDSLLGSGLNGAGGVGAHAAAGAAKTHFSGPPKVDMPNVGSGAAGGGKTIFSDPAGAGSGSAYKGLGTDGAPPVSGETGTGGLVPFGSTPDGSASLASEYAGPDSTTAGGSSSASLPFTDTSLLGGAGPSGGRSFTDPSLLGSDGPSGARSFTDPSLVGSDGPSGARSFTDPSLVGSDGPSGVRSDAATWAGGTEPGRSAEAAVPAGGPTAERVDGSSGVRPDSFLATGGTEHHGPTATETTLEQSAGAGRPPASEAHPVVEASVHTDPPAGHSSEAAPAPVAAHRETTTADFTAPRTEPQPAARYADGGASAHIVPETGTAPRAAEAPTQRVHDPDAIRVGTARLDTVEAGPSTSTPPVSAPAAEPPSGTPAPAPASPNFPSGSGESMAAGSQGAGPGAHSAPLRPSPVQGPAAPGPAAASTPSPGGFSGRTTPTPSAVPNPSSPAPSPTRQAPPAVPTPPPAPAASTPVQSAPSTTRPSSPAASSTPPPSTATTPPTRQGPTNPTTPTTPTPTTPTPTTPTPTAHPTPSTTTEPTPRPGSEGAAVGAIGVVGARPGGARPGRGEQQPAAASGGDRREDLATRQQRERQAELDRLRATGQVRETAAALGHEQRHVVTKPPHAEELVRDLPGMSPQERAQTLDSLKPEYRRWLAKDPTLVDGLRNGLPPRDFAETAAQLLVHVPEGAHQPASARQEAQAQVSRMLQDPDTTARLLKNGAQVTVVPKDVRMTDVPAFHNLRGTHAVGAAGAGRGWDDVRGSGGRRTAVTEENLLGGDTSVGSGGHYADGYSTTTHEFAHTIHGHGLTQEDRAGITQSFDTRDGQKEKAIWPDGTNRHDEHGELVRNYSSKNEDEYFAQVTNAWLGTNHGQDPYTGQDRNNGADWVRGNVPELVPLLERLYGPDPTAVHAEPANPVAAARAEDDMYDGFREFTQGVDGTPQEPHVPPADPQPETPQPETPQPETPQPETPQPAAPESPQPTASATPPGDAPHPPPVPGSAAPAPRQDPATARAGGEYVHTIAAEHALNAVEEFLGQPGAAEFQAQRANLEAYERANLADGDTAALLAQHQQRKELLLDVLKRSGEHDTRIPDDWRSDVSQVYADHFTDHRAGPLHTDPHAEKVAQTADAKGKVSLKDAEVNRNHIIADTMLHKYVASAVFKARTLDPQGRQQAEHAFAEFSGTVPADPHRVLSGARVHNAQKKWRSTPEAAALLRRDLAAYRDGRPDYDSLYGLPALGGDLAAGKQSADAASAQHSYDSVRDALAGKGLDGPLGPQLADVRAAVDRLGSGDADLTAVHDGFDRLEQAVRGQALDDLALVNGVTGHRELDDTAAALDRAADYADLGDPATRTALADRLDGLAGTFDRVGHTPAGDVHDRLTGHATALRDGSAPPPTRDELRQLAADLGGERDGLHRADLDHTEQLAGRAIADFDARTGLGVKPARAAADAARNPAAVASGKAAGLESRLADQGAADVRLVGEQSGGHTARSGPGANRPEALFAEAMTLPAAELPARIAEITDLLSNNSSNLRFGDDKINQWIQNFLDPQVTRDPDLLTGVSHGQLPPEALYTPHTQDVLRGVGVLEAAGLVPPGLAEMMAPKTEAELDGRGASESANRLQVPGPGEGRIPVSSSGDLTQRPGTVRLGDAQVRVEEGAMGRTPEPATPDGDPMDVDSQPPSRPQTPDPQAPDPHAPGPRMPAPQAPGPHTPDPHRGSQGEPMELDGPPTAEPAPAGGGLKRQAPDDEPGGSQQPGPSAPKRSRADDADVSPPPPPPLPPVREHRPAAPQVSPPPPVEATRSGSTPPTRQRGPKGTPSDAPLRLVRTRAGKWQELPAKGKLGGQTPWDTWKELTGADRGSTTASAVAEEMSQHDLHHLVDHLASTGHADLADKLNTRAEQLDAKARAALGEDPAARSDQVIWTGEDIRTRSQRLESDLADLEREYAATGAARSDERLAEHAARVRRSADELSTALGGYVKDAAAFGGTYALRDAHAPLASAARNLADTVDRSLNGEDGQSGPGKPVSPDTLRSLGDAARQFRGRKAYAEVPAGEQWKSVIPDLDSLTPEQRTSFVRDLSRRNVDNLRTDTRDLLAQPEFRSLYERLLDLPYRLKHATPAYHAIANSGVMSSQGDLARRGARFLASGKSSASNTSSLGNDDFVFFRVEANDKPMQTRYGPTTIIFGIEELERLGGWVSLHDQLHPLDRPTMQALRQPGEEEPVRTAAYAPGTGGAGSRSRWTHTYPGVTGEARTHEVSFEQEVFHGADVREGIALSVVREVARIGGDFQQRALRQHDADALSDLVSSLYRPEAKFGSGLPVDLSPEGGTPTGWPRPKAVVNPDGDGRYRPDGTVDPAALAASKESDLADDRRRQADNAEEIHRKILEGIPPTATPAERAKREADALTHRRRAEGFLKPALKSATAARELTERFQQGATGDRQALAAHLLEERRRSESELQQRLTHLQQSLRAPANPTADPSPSTGLDSAPAQSGAAPQDTEPGAARPLDAPADPAGWAHRRIEAPSVGLRGDRPGTGTGGPTLVRAAVRRLQADDGRWVRDFTVTLPFELAPGLTPARLAELRARVQSALDGQVNAGYALPRSGDQLHVTVRMVHAEGHAERITLTATAETATPGAADQRHWDLAHDDAALTHQTLRYLGLPDGTTTAPLTTAHLAAIEDTCDSGTTLRHHPLPSQ
ncbi:hypothetical protein ACIQGZ_09245 [Streptomyces sp. NPDC092296]|uniref:WXG100-like domain-containing protein n=1 Tax=Streptomyces sp. NPDC092296 TaxID=3366012 RepID=UPI00381A8C7D